MSDPYLGEIRMTAFGFAPVGWLPCDGRSLPIQQNQALFGILGTTYGGNGTSTFQLPDLRGRAPVHPGADVAWGQAGGESEHQLGVDEMPAHAHALQAAATASTASPSGAVLAPGPTSSFATTADTVMDPELIGLAGESEAHPNMSPYLAINFIIAITGKLPSTG